MIFGATTILMWAFVMDSQAVIQYFASISAYTGVLVFQVSNIVQIAVTGYALIML
jgi:hypothetical protein